MGKDGSSRGYGFVTFKTREAAIAALIEPVKDIDGRTTTACFAAKGREAPRAQPYRMQQRQQFAMQQQQQNVGVGGNMARAYGGYNAMGAGIGGGVPATAYGGSSGGGYGATYGGTAF